VIHRYLRIAALFVFVAETVVDGILSAPNAQAQASAVTGFGSGASFNCSNTGPACGGNLDAGAKCLFFDNMNCQIPNQDKQWNPLGYYCVQAQNSFTDAGILYLAVVNNMEAGAAQCTNNDGSTYNNGGLSVASLYTTATFQYGTFCARVALPPFATNNWASFIPYGINCQGPAGTNTPGCTAGTTWTFNSLEPDILETIMLGSGQFNQILHSYVTATAGGSAGVQYPTQGFHTYCGVKTNGASVGGGGVNDAGLGLSFWSDGVNTFGPSGPGYGNSMQMVDSSVGPIVPANFMDQVFLSLTNNNRYLYSEGGVVAVDWVYVFCSNFNEAGVCIGP
jgi:hypothetical protein